MFRGELDELPDEPPDPEPDPDPLPEPPLLPEPELPVTGPFVAGALGNLGLPEHPQEENTQQRIDTTAKYRNITSRAHLAALI